MSRAGGGGGAWLVTFTLLTHTHMTDCAGVFSPQTHFCHSFPLICCSRRFKAARVAPDVDFMRSTAQRER